MNETAAKQSDFLTHLTHAKDRLHAAIKGLDESVLCNQGIVGHWTIKDILGHLASWNREFRDNIAMILDDDHPGYDHQISGADDFSAWNQNWVDGKRAWSLDQILADVECDYQEAVELIMALNLQQLSMRGLTPWNDTAQSESDSLKDKDMDGVPLPIWEAVPLITGNSVEELVSYHWSHMTHHAAEIEIWRAG